MPLPFLIFLQITSATVIDRDDIDGHPHGFAIHVNDGVSPTWYLRAENTREKKSWLMRLDHVHAIVRWLEDFEKVRVLGVGGTGIVYEILHKTNGQRYALKEMEIKNKAQMQMALQEAEMLKDIMENISHPNILHIEKVFQVGSKFYLVFPLCCGGELYDHVIRRGHFSEHDAAVLTRDLISGLHALHERDILHLDIKPENLLFESDREDARIKITDFGLSKLYKYNDGAGGANGGCVDERDREPSRDELAAKLKAFAESGVLQRDKLRGTVGYMSPELILAGSCSKATDVWAAGVVLYILLCGRPPFQSKSNREILERSARGQYQMEGEEWENISDDAKDLVRKMLIVDPKDRISTANILAHPWLKSLEDPMVGNSSTMSEAVLLQSVKDGPGLVGAGSVAGMLGTKNASSVRKMSSQNLQGALKRLSGFVADRKVEKLATSFTRLVSSLNSDQDGGNDLLAQFLYPERALLSKNRKGKDGQPAPVSAIRSDEDDDNELTQTALQALLNPDTRDALAEAFNDVGSNNGKLTIEQFIAVLKHFNFAGTEGNSTYGSGGAAGGGGGADSSGGGGGGSGPISGLIQALGVPALLFIRFVDRDGDGMISADDIFTTHAYIMQFSAVFVRVSKNAMCMCACWCTCLITHLFDVFVCCYVVYSLHSSPQAVFRVYVEAIWYPGRQINFLNLQRGGTTSGAAKKPGGYKVMEDQTTADVVEPPRYITARHVSAVFEKLGYDAAGGAKLFNILCETLAKRGQLGVGTGMGSGAGGEDSPAPARASVARASVARGTNSALLGDDDEEEDTNNTEAQQSTSALPNTALVAAFSTEEDEIRKLSGITDSMSLNAIATSAAAANCRPLPPEPPATPQSPVASRAGGPGASGYKMDVNDFVRAAEIDKVLVKILLIRPKKKLNHILRRMAAEQAAKAGETEATPSASTFLQHMSSEGMKGEIQSALTQANLINGGNGSGASRERTISGSNAFPIANSIGRFARGLYEGVTAPAATATAVGMPSTPVAGSGHNASGGTPAGSVTTTPTKY